MAWASGLRLYMTLFMAGTLGRLGWLELPSSLQVLQSPWVLGVAGVLLVVEFLADKIPGVDSAWDAVQTKIPRALSEQLRDEGVIFPCDKNQAGGKHG